MLTIDFDRLDVREGDLVLDLGCGEGRHVLSLFKEFNIWSVGLDLGFDDVQKTKYLFDRLPENEPSENTGWQLFCGNALQLPFADQSFDHIVCSEVLEHIPDYKSALKEIYRILKPGGTLIVSVPRYWPERICWAFSDEYHEVEGGHVRIFNASTLKNNIETMGLKCWAKHWAHSLHSPFWWLKTLFWDNRDNNKLVQLYHRFLVWDITKQPLATKVLDKCLNPIMGKSVVFYFTKGVER